MDSPPVVSRRRRAAAGVALVPLPCASRRKNPTDSPPVVRRPRRVAAGVPLVSLPRPSRRKNLISSAFVGYIASGLPKRKYDGFFPVLTSEVTAANRKKRKLIHDRWFGGRVPD